MAFPKTIVDRTQIAKIVKEYLPWVRVVAGAKGYPFISIESQRDRDDDYIIRAGRILMWDTKDFDHPTILDRLPARPQELGRWKTLYRCSVDPILSGPGWCVLAALELVNLANGWLRIRHNDKGGD